MLKTLFRRKLSDEQLANVFVNAMLDCVDKGFDEVVELIKEDPAFVTVPDLENYSDGHFTMIVIVANLSFLGDHFDPQQCADLENLIKEKFADIFGMSKDVFDTHLNNYKKFMARVNHPSKNMHYAMSKGMFHKYQLNEYQDGYFKKMKCPNPLFLKRMDEVMDSFVWNWDAFFKRYKMVG
ncbi:hypothetical protein [Lishizhenia sp.]|uniref:hypothetical protein n=1 Tax=Lishizhenia sp. TaxID=2497594 RepID=UPI00299E30C6|nr:hypothetical protein [Lishizhenia sp.]MDX1445635.1 hypothetical protein [Lishizhenia sp.]